MNRTITLVVFFVLLIAAVVFGYLVWLVTDNVLAWGIASLFGGWIAGVEAAKWERYIAPREDPF